MFIRLIRIGGLVVPFLILGLLPALKAQNLAEFEQKVTEFTLDNGLEVIVVERHEAPVVTMLTHADVGGVDELKGITGIAHMFEHMAFKGTTRIGATDLDKELAAMAHVDDLFIEYQTEKNKGIQADSARLVALNEAFEGAKKEAQELGNSSEMEMAIERAGGTGLNATTSSDETMYFYSLPSNKLELWFALESERFLNPVLREFYIERDVVMEERRMRTDSNPFGRLIEEMLTTAFKAHPYGEPVIGHMSDLQSFTRAEAEAFFRTYYVPNNLTIAIVGDVDPQNVRDLAESYFGRIPAGPEPPRVETIEPPQIGERRIVIEEQAQPIFLMGFHKGSALHPDEPVYNVISDIISRGRTSRLYKRLVEGEKMALQAAGFSGFPGNKYPNLMIFFAVPTQGFTAEDCERAIMEELDRLKHEPVSADELAKAKSRARADLVRQLGSNTGLAFNLATTHALTGNWRNLFLQLDALEAVTADDIMRVAGETFVSRNRTAAMIKTTPKEDETAGR